jgi:hypothetical protein
MQANQRAQKKHGFHHAFLLKQFQTTQNNPKQRLLGFLKTHI